jgi:hypothetical protein
VITDDRQPEPWKVSAQLIRCVDGTMSAHELEVPRTVDLADIIRVAVDDYRGTVYLLSSSGVLHCISYA